MKYKKIILSILIAVFMALFYLSWHEYGHAAIYSVFGCAYEFRYSLHSIQAAGYCDAATYDKAQHYLAIQEIINYSIMPFITLLTTIYVLKNIDY